MKSWKTLLEAAATSHTFRNVRLELMLLFAELCSGRSSLDLLRWNCVSVFPRAASRHQAVVKLTCRIGVTTKSKVLISRPPSSIDQVSFHRTGFLLRVHSEENKIKTLVLSGSSLLLVNIRS